MARAILLVAFVFCAVCIVEPQTPAGTRGRPTPPRDPVNRAGAPTATGPSRIEGRVAAAGTGQPLRGATVFAVAEASSQTYTAYTRDDGSYTLVGLEAGSYLIRAQFEGFARATYGAGVKVAVGDKQVRAGINLAMTRGGVITGSIMDETGYVAANMEVLALRSQRVRGVRRLVRAGPLALTDDRGEFRLFGLESGSYYLLASPVNRPRASPGTSDESREGFAATYYPGTASLSDAQALRVGAGETQSVAFSLTRAKLGEIRGLALGADGVPLPGPVLVRPTSGAMQGTSVSVQRDGSFRIRALAPGTYSLSAGGTAQFGSSQSMATVALGDGQTLFVTLEPVSLVSVSGRMIIHGPPSRSIEQLGLQAAVMPIETQANGLRPAGTVRTDLSFSLPAWPGRGIIEVRSRRGDVAVERVRINGQDVTDTGFEVRNGVDVDDVQIELTTQFATVSGRLKPPASAASRDYVVALFARDSRLWTAASGRHLALAPADALGQFKVTSLPPGDYYAVALPRLLDDQWQEPEFLTELRSRATRFSLGRDRPAVLELELRPLP